eukprot:Em0002g1503a
MISLYWGLKNPIVLAPGAIYAKQKMQYRDSVYEFNSAPKTPPTSRSSTRATKRRDLSDMEVQVAQGDHRQHQGEPRGGGKGGGRGPRSNTQVRKRSASFRKVSKQKKMEESKLNESHGDKRSRPPHGTPPNLRVTNTMSSNEVIGMLLQKYNVENSPSDFTLCVRRDTGVMEPFREEDVPLMVRLRLGPSEDIAKIFVLEASEARLLEVTEETANWMKFSEAELNIFIKKFNEEEEKETKKIVERFKPWRTAIRQEQENIKQNGNGHRKSRTGSWIETDV